EKTTEYTEIQGMLTRLRERGREQPQQQEPTAVITVRLPKSLHDALRLEAHDRRISMNKLCIAKLVQSLDASAAAVDSGDEEAEGTASVVRFARHESRLPIEAETP